MTVGQAASGVTYKADRYKLYHLLSVPTIDKKYLFITVTAEEIYSHLGVSLLIYKQGTQTPLQKCLKEEVDTSQNHDFESFLSGKTQRESISSGRAQGTDNEARPKVLAVIAAPHFLYFKEPVGGWSRFPRILSILRKAGRSRTS
jgi:hypothetical protein